MTYSPTTPSGAVSAQNPLVRALDSQRGHRSGRRLKMRSQNYDAIISLMLASPGITQRAIAAKLGKTEVWVGYIVRSDAFKLLYSERREDNVARIGQGIVDVLSDVALGSLKIVADEIRDNPSKFTPKAAMEVAAMSLDKLGYGRPSVNVAGPQVTVQQNTIVATPDMLVEARATIRELETLKAQKPLPVPGPSPGLAIDPTANAQRSLSALIGDDVSDVELEVETKSEVAP